MESYNHGNINNNVVNNTSLVCDGDVIEIFPFEEYDWNRSKLRASLSWLLSKAYPSNVPKELQDPFYQTSDDQLVLRPVMVNLMTSSELYCQACSNMFPETHTQWQGHWSIIQILSRKGIYIADVQDSSVTETVLVQTAPIRLKAHLALIDALMKAYTCEVASVEKVVTAVRRFTTFPASSELPDTPEEALLFWINKVCTVLRTDGLSTRGLEGVIEGDAGQKVRVLGKSTYTREPIQVSLLKDLITDIGDGCSIAAVIAFYRPHLLNVKDLCLKKGIGVADSLHNLRQIEQFCQHHLPWKCFHLSYEDLLYSHEGMKLNIIAFLADLFFCFEGPGSTQATDSGLSDAKSPKEKVEVVAAGAGKAIPSVPISLVTKRSFQRQSLEETANNLGMGRPTVSSTSVHQPLLPRRGRRSIPQEEGRISGSPPVVRKTGRRTLSLCSPQDRDSVHKSVLAWQDDQRIPHRSDERESSFGGRRGLLANVSIDSELDESFNTNNNLSLDLSELDTPRYANSAAYDPNHPDYMELESVSTGKSRFSSSPQQYTDHRVSKTPTVSHADHRLEPLMPAMIRPPKERETISKEQERGDSRVILKKKGATPPPPPPQQSQRFQEQMQQPAETDDLDVSLSESSDETNVSSLAPTSSTVSSFTMEDTASSTVQSPRAAVLPSSRDLSAAVPQSAADSSREGSISSSGDYSDHESKKIHQEYQARESGLATSPAINTADTVGGRRLIPVISGHEQGSISTNGADETAILKSPSSTTSFAELKRLREKLGHGHDMDTILGAGTVTKLNKEQQGGSDSGLCSPLSAPSEGVGETNGIDLGLSELQQLRLKLEQKRKEIERKKHRQELQQNKMRQRLGKAAFMRVVSKHLEGSDEDELCDLPDTRRPEYLPTSTQAQLQARLGHPVGGTYRSPPPTHQYPVHMNIGSGSQSAFTDWQTQSLLSRVGSAAAHRPGNLDQAQQQFLMSRAGSPGAVAAAFNSSALSHAPRPFSREGIQQTIDNVRNKWFKAENGVPARGKSREEDGIDGDSYRLLGHDHISGDSYKTLDPTQCPSRSHLESPNLGSLQGIVTHSTTPPIPIPTREATASPSSVSEMDNHDYDSSLDRLNSSLTELQGEIMRLSLQQEKLGTAQPSVNPESSVILSGPKEAPSRMFPSPRQGMSQEPQYMPEKAVGRQEALLSQQQHTSPAISYMHDSGVTADSNNFQPSLINSSQSSAFKRELASDALRQHTSDADSESTSATTDNFFVSLGDATQKQPKLKPKEHLVSSKPPFSNKEESAMPVESAAKVSSTAEITADVAAALAGQAVLDTLSLQKSDPAGEDSSPKVGFIIKDEAAIVREQVIEDEMQKKRVKLMEMQRKRKEEQEKKRTEKEEEMAKKHEEKQIKEEEQERKKAEEKARREVIFQQYLQKKQEDDETPAKPQAKKRDGSASKQRPKSMFVKSKAMTPEPGALAPDSVSSSQEDLTDRAHPPGRSAPNIMSTMRSSFHARLPQQPSQIRKAVSCNVLQGTLDGTLGASSNRRPTSPDLYRTKQRHRGSSQDSGSETGSGSNPGSDYAGPKLFVKPSAKSNRHIIVNAISHCCLAGSVNTDLKNKVLDEMSKCEANHFLVLFRDAGCQYRGLYVFYPETEEAFKVHGVGPKHITNDLCEKFYKYNSGGKSFSEITSTKHLSVSVDAVVLHGSVWKSGKAVVKR
ncbi:hypothetical protein BsWGS_14034 [Bradybaena similaris]